jgi:hypothetical protein
MFANNQFTVLPQQQNERNCSYRILFLVAIFCKFW